MPCSSITQHGHDLADEALIIEPNKMGFALSTVAAPKTWDWHSNALNVLKLTNQHAFGAMDEGCGTDFKRCRRQPVNMPVANGFAPQVMATARSDTTWAVGIAGIPEPTFGQDDTAKSLAQSERLTELHDEKIGAGGSWQLIRIERDRHCRSSSGGLC